MHEVPQVGDVLHEQWAVVSEGVPQCPLLVDRRAFGQQRPDGVTGDPHDEERDRRHAEDHNQACSRRLTMNMVSGLRRSRPARGRAVSGPADRAAVIYLPLAEAIASTPFIGIVQSIPSLTA